LKRLFKSKIFIKQFISFFIIICMTFATLSLILLAVTRASLGSQQLVVARGYRQETSENIKRWIKERQYDIRIQAMYIEEFLKDKLRDEEISELLARQLGWNEYYYDIAIIDIEGNIINSRQKRLNDINVEDRQYFINAINGQATVEGFIKSKKDGVPVMAISEPLRIDGHIEYVIAGYVALEKIKNIVSSLNLGELGHAYLVNSEGAFITNSDFISEFIKYGGIKDKDKYRIDTYAVNQVLKKESGTSSYRDFTNNKVHGSYEWLDILGMGLIVEFKDSMVMKPLYDLIGIMGVLGLLVIALAIIFSFVLSRKIVHPVNLLISAAEEITAQNYCEPLKVKTGDELDSLVRQFNSMQSAIQLREEQLHKKNDELKVQRAEAIEASILKSQFLANMSHELRTPLNSIIGFTGRVLKKSGDILPKVQKENLEIVKEEAQHLLDLINDLLDYSKLEAGKMEVHVEPFNLVRVVDEVNNIVRNLAENKPIIYKQRLYDSDSIPIFSDRMKLKQILINLLSNAFKYSEKGTIELTIENDSGGCRISVSDEGIGIAKEHIDHIFEEFRQIDGTYTRKVGGTGLGLSITKRFVEMLGGTITVESQPGKGSCFTIYLPTQTQEVKHQVFEEINEIALGQRKVVCIDDDPNVQRLYKQYLAERGFEAVCLSGKEDVIAKIKEVEPDIILLDIMLPNRDGWDILGELKGNQHTHKIPVVMVSVLSEQKLAYRMKADDFLIKPVSQEELMDTIDRTILKREGVDIIIADDDENYLNLMAQFLKEEAVSFRLARNGEEALRLMKEKVPDLAILDIMMPGIDGFGVIEEMDKDEELSDIAVIVVTAKDLSKQEQEYLRDRTSTVIQKSGTHIDRIMDMLLNIIREKEARNTEK
jgi:signal transduction histidine kinase/DNA-binding response OmpR family regulator